MDTQAIFLVGWFRSGTSMLWNLLKSTGLYHCYYEPFHEHLPHLAYTRCKHRVDPTHLAIGNYWDEYQIVPKEEFLKYWKPWFGQARWRMTENDRAPDMEAYIRHLAARSEKPAVFKFVRASFRLSWLRKTFPEARIIWINRDPRKVWDSMQKRDTSIAAVPGNPEITQQGFSNYILQMAMEMGFSIRDDLYGTFYDMWVSSFMEAKNQVDDIWWYEDILADYPGWAKTHLVDAGITESIPPYEVKNPGTIYYANTVPRYLASELKQTLPSTSPPNHAVQRILDEVPSRNREIVLLQSRILDLEAELCRERERQYLSTRNPLYLLKEKAKKNWLKLQKRFIKL